MNQVVFYLTIALTAAFLILSKTFSPIWLLIFVLAVLWPRRREPEVRPIFLIDFLLFGVYFLIQYFALLVPFIVGLGFAYIFAPAVDFLDARKVPRIIGILIILLPVTFVFPLLVFLISANLINEIQLLVSKVPSFVQQGQVLLSAWLARLNQSGIAVDPNIIANTITSHLDSITNTLFGTFTQLGQGIKGILIIGYNLVFIPLSAYLFLADRKPIGAWIRNIFPAEESRRIDGFIARLNESLAHFFRGQIIFMIIVGLIVGVALWLLGIRYYLLIAILAALCNLIPNIGFIISLLFALLIGLTSPSPLANCIKIAAVFLGEQLLENFVLGPYIIGRAARLHPVVVMIVLVLGGAVLGAWGVILAVPLTIFMREFLNYFLGMRL
jgi:predicted PurR-regulated permease PerM